MVTSKLFAIVLSTAAVLASNEASAYTVYNSLGGVENGGDPLSVAGPYLNDWIKIGRAAVLTSATFNLSLAGTPSGSFDVWAAKIVPGGISQYATIATIKDTSLSSSFTTYTVKASYALDPGSFYVVGLYDSNNSNAVWGNTLDPSVLARHSVANGAYYYNNGGVQANAFGPYELAANVAGVPEPAAWSLMLVGFGMVGYAVRRRSVMAAA